MPVTKEFYKQLILAVVGVVAILVLFSFERIPQDANYHSFADTEVVAGIPNFWNVLSNFPFLAVGLFSLWRVPRLSERECMAAYIVLSTGIGLIGFGSAYYHYAPSNETLLWDRLPMTIAFMALFSMLLGERVIIAHKTISLWFLIGCGIAAACYWSWTESNGREDLRPYAVVQFLPILLMPLIMAMFTKKYLSNHLLLQAFAWYLVAKALEQYDHQAQSLLGIIGGHPLKHVAAAMAALCIIRSVPVSAPNKSLKVAP
ncbi:ceramidase domain-containing protein [Nitrosomonas europaea]|uniref:ceramidase domain-containing protein n=1 Tax=Nitrosomonas europaea TaxID=915 RepID=UPI0032650519